MTDTPSRYDNPLGQVELASDLLRLEQMTTAIDGIAPLIGRAITAIDTGHAARARRILDHAEGMIPDSGGLPAPAADTLAEIRATIGRLRVNAEGAAPDGGSAPEGSPDVPTS